MSKKNLYLKRMHVFFNNNDKIAIFIYPHTLTDRLTDWLTLDLSIGNQSLSITFTYLSL